MPVHTTMANATQQPGQQMAVANQAVVPQGQPVMSAQQQMQSQAQAQSPTSSVAGNLNNLLQQNSAYLTQARQSGQNQAARRGLANSTLAGQAAEGQAIQAALPIAQQEAEQEQQRQLQQAQQEFQERQTGLTTSANLQGQYTTQAQGLLNQYAISINEIETAQDITTADKNKLIQNTIKRRDADLKFLQQMYSALPTWQTDWTKLPSFGGAPGIG